MKMLTVTKLDKVSIRQRGIPDWPVWEKEVSRFDWHYDRDEECLILEGLVVVETDEGPYTIGAGDFVTFRQGLRCTWDVRKPIRKHYNFP